MSTIQLETITRAWPSLHHLIRVPRRPEEYHELVSLLDDLIDAVGEDEAHPLASLMDVLGVLIEKYEDEHVSELA